MATPPVGLLVTRPTPTATLELIVRAEERGVSAAWSTVGGTTPDAVTLIAAAATRTHQITLGTAIVPIYPRHPLVLASQALVLADLAPGRVRLGLGPSHRPIIEGMFGLPFVQPLAYLREYLTVLRHLLWDGQVDHAGPFLTVHATLPAGTTPPRTPLLISALRANAFHLAGEIQLPAWGGAQERDVDDAPPVLVDGRGERRVGRCIDDDAAARWGGQAQHLGGTDHDIRHEDHPLGIDRPSEPGAREVGERVGEAGGVRVAGVAARDGCDERPADGVRQRDVHLGHEGRQDVGGVGGPLLAAPLAELHQRTGVKRIGPLT